MIMAGAAGNPPPAFAVPAAAAPLPERAAAAGDGRQTWHRIGGLCLARMKGYVKQVLALSLPLFYSIYRK